MRSNGGGGSRRPRPRRRRGCAFDHRLVCRRRATPAPLPSRRRRLSIDSDLVRRRRRAASAPRARAACPPRRRSAAAPRLADQQATAVAPECTSRVFSLSRRPWRRWRSAARLGLQEQLVLLLAGTSTERTLEMYHRVAQRSVLHVERVRGGDRPRVRCLRRAAICTASAEHRAGDGGWEAHPPGEEAGAAGRCTPAACGCPRAIRRSELERLRRGAERGLADATSAVASASLAAHASSVQARCQGRPAGAGAHLEARCLYASRSLCAQALARLTNARRRAPPGRRARPRGTRRRRPR